MNWILATIENLTPYDAKWCSFVNPGEDPITDLYWNGDDLYKEFKYFIPLPEIPEK